jgi:hypothetical protein
VYGVVVNIFTVVVLLALAGLLVEAVGKLL